MGTLNVRASFLSSLQLDRGNLIPRHEQLKDRLAEAIGDGRLKPGDLLPSERELAVLLGISRMTVRRALTELKAQGQLTSRFGKGWSVVASKIGQSLAGLTGFSADMRALGMQVESRVIELKMCVADQLGAQELGVQGQPFYALTRVRLVNGEPIALETTFVSQQLCPGLERFDLSRDSLYRVLREEYGLALAWGNQEVEAALPTPREASILNMAPDIPVLRASRVVYTPHNQVVEFGMASYRGDRYKYRMKLGGAGNGVGVL